VLSGLLEEESSSLSDKYYRKQVKEYERNNEREEGDVYLFVTIALIHLEVDFITANFHNFSLICHPLFCCDLNVSIHILYAFLIINRVIHMGATFHKLMIL